MASPPDFESDVARRTRGIAYVSILLKAAKVDVKKTLPGDLLFLMASPFEERGFTTSDIDQWIADCDPPTRPAWDPVTCFEEKVRVALAPRHGLALSLAVIGGASFLAAFLIQRAHR